MNKLKAIAGCVLFLIFCIQASAQTSPVPVNEPDYNKPKIFADLPNQMTIRVVDAEKLFGLRAGTSSSVQLTDELFLKGTVVSNGESNGMRTIIIRATNRNNAVFTFTRITSEDGTTSYAGRIMSRDNGDAFLIKKEDNAFVLKKINLYDLISE